MHAAGQTQAFGNGFLAALMFSSASHISMFALIPAAVLDSPL